MSAGKSKRLIHDYNALEGIFGAENILVLKPAIDTRSPSITSRGLNQTLNCIPMEEDEEWKTTIRLGDYPVIIVDEIQFLSQEDVKWLHKEEPDILLMYGLDKDFTGNYFPAFRTAKDLADREQRLFAVCDSCGKPATHSKLLRTSCDNEDHIVIGDEIYSPRCSDCL